jgi:hypothetical protein
MQHENSIKMKKNKYNAKKTIGADGRTYDSKLEAKRAYELQLMEKAGEIELLQYQVPFKLTAYGKHICTYKADFTYWRDGDYIVEDVKGVRAALFNLKAKLFEAQYCDKITIYPPKRRKSRVSRKKRSL